MKHTQSCPKCSGSGLVSGEDGIDDICPECEYPVGGLAVENPPSRIDQDWPAESVKTKARSLLISSTVSGTATAIGSFPVKADASDR